MAEFTMAATWSALDTSVRAKKASPPASRTSLSVSWPPCSDLNVDSMVAVDGGVHHGRHLVRLGHIGASKKSLASRLSNKPFGFLAPLLIDVNDHHSGPFFRKFQGAGAAYSRSRAGNNGYSVLKSHDAFLHVK